MTDTAPRLVTLREATPEDCRRIWEWRNEPLTRDSSFDNKYIPYQEHERWFKLKLQDSETAIFVVSDGTNREVGYVRFSVENDTAEISVSIDPGERGKGYGPAAITIGSDRVLSSGRVKHIVAHVKLDNPPSLEAFKRAGFVLTGTSEASGATAYRLVYPNL